MLRPQQATLFEAAYETGLSGTGRLHDLFVRLEAMTPGEYKNGGENLTISYNFLPSPYGPLLAAATARGLCFLGFADDPEQAFAELRHRYPNATFLQEKSPVEEQLIAFFEEKTTTSGPLHLHLKGTDFQLKVWEMLLKIPEGQASTYGELARQLGSPGASRAVGTAVGDNPVAWLIPCHRVIQQSGALGGYHWGTARKQALLAREAARSESMKT